MPEKGTLTREVIDALRDQIEANGPDYVLGTERELQEEYGVSRNVIRAAVAELRDVEGLVERHGKRYRARIIERTPFVMTRPVQFTVPGAPLAVQPLVTTTPLIERRIPDLAIADLLRLRHDEEAVVHIQHYIVSGIVSGVALTYFSVQVADRFANLAKTDARDLEKAAQGSGYPLVRKSDVVFPRMPTTKEKVDWRIPGGVPIQEHARTLWDNDDEAICHTRTVTVGDRLQLEYYLPAETVISN